MIIIQSVHPTPNQTTDIDFANYLSVAEVAPIASVGGDKPDHRYAIKTEVDENGWVTMTSTRMIGANETPDEGEHLMEYWMGDYKGRDVHACEITIDGQKYLFDDTKEHGPDLSWSDMFTYYVVAEGYMLDQSGSKLDESGNKVDDEGYSLDAEGNRLKPTEKPSGPTLRFEGEFNMDMTIEEAGFGRKPDDSLKN